MLYCCLSVAVEKDFQILQCEALVIVVVLLWKGFPKTQCETPVIF